MIETPSAKVIAHSKAANTGIEIVTLQTRMPRIILAEFNTHGAIAKNARSTRAVPTSKLIKEVRDNPYIPTRWGCNNPGMQTKTWITDPIEIRMLETQWRKDAADAADKAQWYLDNNVHKQWAGRQLEPFMWVDSVITATDWANFDGLRNHPDAQPEFEDLAKAIKEAISSSTPKLLNPGEWHLPYIDLSTPDTADMGMYLTEIRPMGEARFPDWQRKKPNNQNAEFQEYCNDILRKISVARCARVSYAPFDGNGSIEKELERYDLLVTSKPVHASPTEHQATPDTGNILERNCKKEMFWDHPEEHGRFYGWRQFRHMIPGNTIWDEHYNV